MGNKKIMQSEQKQKIYLNTLITIVAVVTGIYHIIQIRWMILPMDQHKVIHVGSGLVLAFLVSLATTKQGRCSILNKFVSWMLVLLSISLSAYIIINYYSIVTKIGRSDTNDLVVGGLLILLVLEAIRRSWGAVIPSVIILSLAYGYFGSYLPGIFFHGGLTLQRLIAYSSIYFKGIYGSLVSLSAAEVFMFVLFGCVLEAAGGIELFMNIAAKFGGRLRSGPSQAAILGSGLMGTITGSVAVNVATIGKVAIPMMIKNKYSKEEAGAIEAVAATGGQLMPPVMGITAFIMASTTSTHYFVVCKTALIPALIFYFFLAYSAQLKALKKNIPISKEENNVNLLQIFKKDGYILLSIIILVYCLAIYMPPAIAAFNAIISLFFFFAIKTLMVRRKIGPFIKDMYKFFIETFSLGAKQGTKIGLILSGLGIMVELFVATGFAQKISFNMIELSGGILIIMLALIGITCILFGMGLPTVGTYMVVSVLAAPALVKLGIPLLTAHMFVFYYGLMAMVTPPVGVGAIVAAGLAEGNYLKTAIMATKLSLPGFILPFMFVYRPAILWMNVTIFEALITFVFVLTGFVCLISILERYFFTRLNILEMLVMSTSCYFLWSPDNWRSLIGLILFVIISVFQYRKRKRLILNVDKLSKEK